MVDLSVRVFFFSELDNFNLRFMIGFNDHFLDLGNLFDLLLDDLSYFLSLSLGLGLLDQSLKGRDGLLNNRDLFMQLFDGCLGLFLESKYVPDDFSLDDVCLLRDFLFDFSDLTKQFSEFFDQCVSDIECGSLRNRVFDHFELLFFFCQQSFFSLDHLSDLHHLLVDLNDLEVNRQVVDA